jgi:hypothetical protein
MEGPAPAGHRGKIHPSFDQTRSKSSIGRKLEARATFRPRPAAGGPADLKSPY